MKNFLFILGCFLIAACGPRPASLGQSASEKSAESDAIFVLEGFSSPESVIGIDTILFVSNVGEELQPLLKDGDGFISKLGKSGKILERKFITGLDAPKGMAIWDSVLYVADIDKIRVYHIQTGDSLDLFDFSEFGVKFLNDLCQGDSGFVYASATLQNKLYHVDVWRRSKLNPISPQSVPKSAAVRGINGLYYDAPSRDLYAVGFGDQDSTNGTISVTPLGPRAVPPRRWKSHSGKLDGIAVIDGRVYFTDWNGFEKGESLYMLDLGTAEVEALPLGSIGGPADFWYDFSENRFWIPAMTEGKLYVFEMKKLSNEGI